MISFEITKARPAIESYYDSSLTCVYILCKVILAVANNLILPGFQCDFGDYLFYVGVIDSVEMAVQLIIKSATQSVEDFALSCEMTWTIAQVKEQLSNEYPTKPKKEHQKLIYGGRLLPDHLSLKNVLNHTQDVHTMHLVCPTSVAPQPVKSNDKKEQSVASVYTASPPPNPTGVYPQMNPQTIAPGLNSSLPGSSLSANTIPDPTQQYLVMQQMYMQMMSQYFAQLNGSNPYGPFLANTPPVQPPPATTSRPNVQQNDPARQGEEEERDYIDYLYVFSRIAVLAALLLYYSSPMRVMGVLVMLLSVSLLAQIIRQQRREEMQRQRGRQQSATADQASTDNQASENEQVPETSTGSESVSSEPQNTNQPATSVPYTIFTLVTAFFSSLIPTDPLPVNVN
ncbi:Homocysteine-responsive endoplasmic reticulum-resident ubiquitin-like domain member 2 protein [Araneus ventricosus]|uniref:Homocysteine-responsive endoplasmic reticulum-resident ubiquitin-like domain member 2 protein n=1 Tax=Araneus ventricosus TaxID=182803 RepID=A0A4Y2DEE2_ARAVE|nr:Homocysteine-responsive endoplasmic reticulum-resident ubiquitin-like domain member 2 protein [Araneus ventricosus]